MNSRPARNRQLGAGKLKSLLILLVIGAAIYAAVKIVPAYMNNYQLQDTMTSEARFATSTYPKKTPDDIRDDLYRKMQELGVPAKKRRHSSEHARPVRWHFTRLRSAGRSVDLSVHFAISPTRRQPFDLE